MNMALLYFLNYQKDWKVVNPSALVAQRLEGRLRVDPEPNFIYLTLVSPPLNKIRIFSKDQELTFPIRDF
ncbi:MAG: hypothetical protein FJ107_04135 [Deltaproteobacteria bacterium]|nr:hypothetical protein [Deltaproteobacteria bacterium]